MIVTSDAGFWEELRRRPLAQRLAPAPAELIDYVTLFNTATGNPQRPRPVITPLDFLGDVRRAIEELPPVVQQMLERELLGICVASGLGSSAITDVVFRPSGEVMGSVVALDLDALAQRTANEWATWKENTPFSRARGMRLEARIAEPATDNRQSAIQYLLLHEFGHVLTAGKALIPDWWVDPQQMQASGAYRFLPLAWQIADNKQIVPLPENDFPQRRRVEYYTGAKLAGDELPAVYQALEKTSFPTLYAATNVYDDFAECFATYVHAALLHKPYEISIFRNGVVIMRPEACWLSRRCAMKYRFLETYLVTD